ncbi:MAG TPA: hypothetical protein VHT30_11295 [Acidimicrobiales bacterium]|jgi:hypothetical protein|nr:hypothetical protein [Acidimicrobiales bacterium]
MTEPDRPPLRDALLEPVPTGRDVLAAVALLTAYRDPDPGRAGSLLGALAEEFSVPEAVQGCLLIASTLLTRLASLTRTEPDELLRQMGLTGSQVIDEQ